jgi:Mg/Co/Ni transporter MgtE
VVSTIDSTPSEDVAKILNDIYKGKTPEKSIAKLGASEDPKSRNEALEIFHTLVNEMIVSKIQNKEFAQFVESLKYMAAEDMLKVSFGECICGYLNVCRRRSLPSMKC